MKKSIVILILRNTRYYRVVTVLMSLEQGFSTGVNFTYPWGKFNDAEVAILHFFSTALVSKQKTGGKIYVRKLAKGKREKKG